MTLTDNLAQQLNTIRRKRGLSVVEFAEMLGVSRSSLQSLLNGSGNPRTDTIEYIAQQLDTDPLALLSPCNPEPVSFTADALASAICTVAKLPERQKEILQLRLLEISDMIG